MDYLNRKPSVSHLDNMERKHEGSKDTKTKAIQKATSNAAENIENSYHIGYKMYDIRYKRNNLGLLPKFNPLPTPV